MVSSLHISCDTYFHAIHLLKSLLLENPNVLPLLQWVETDKAVYMIRQYL